MRAYRAQEHYSTKSTTMQQRVVSSIVQFYRGACSLVNNDQNFDAIRIGFLKSLLSKQMYQATHFVDK